MSKNGKIIFLCLIIASLVSFLNQEYIIFPLFIFFAGLFIGAFSSILSKKEDRNFLLVLFLGAYFIRIVASVFLYNIVFIFNGRGLLGDGYGYSESGYSIFELWNNGVTDVDKIIESVIKVSVSGNLGSYDFWNAMVYSVTGKSPLSMIFINCSIYSLIIFPVYYITKQVGNRRSAMIAAFLTAFWPSLFIWSVQNFKESLTIFLVTNLFWVVLLLKIKFRFYLLFILTALSMALYEFRKFYFFIFYLITLPFSFILYLLKKKKTMIFIIFMTTGIIFFMLFVNLLKEHIPYLISFTATDSGSGLSFLEWLDKFRSYRTYGNTAFLSGWNLTNPLSLMIFTPLALLIAWLAPFPWQLSSISQALVVPEALVYYLLLPFVFIGIGSVLKKNLGDGLIIFVNIFIMILIMAFVEGNIGTLFRHRAMVLPFMFVLIGVGLDKVRFKTTTCI